jgi:hypothetical protein
VVLSKRERYIAIGVLAAVGIFGLDYFFVGPLWAARADLDKKIAEKSDDVRKEKKMIDESRRRERTWADMQKNGLRRRDDSEAAAPVMSSINEWAKDNVVLSTVKPERSEKEKDFQKQTFRATASGRMRDIREFLIRIQESPIPVKVSDLQLSAHKEGTDDLSLQIGISTAYLLPDADKDKNRPAAAAREVTP